MTKEQYPEKTIGKLIAQNKWPFPVTDRSNKVLVFNENIRNGKLKTIQRENRKALRRQNQTLPEALL